MTVRTVTVVSVGSMLLAHLSVKRRSKWWFLFYIINFPDDHYSPSRSLLHLLKTLVTIAMTDSIS